MPLVIMFAFLRDKISVRRPFQPPHLLHIAFFSRYFHVAETGSEREHRDELGKFDDKRRPKALPISMSTSSDAGRDPVAVTTSRHVAEGDPDAQHFDKQL